MLAFQLKREDRLLNQGTFEATMKWSQRSAESVFWAFINALHPGDTLIVFDFGHYYLEVTRD